MSNSNEIKIYACLPAHLPASGLARLAAPSQVGGRAVPAFLQGAGGEAGSWQDRQSTLIAFRPHPQMLMAVARAMASDGELRLLSSAFYSHAWPSSLPSWANDAPGGQGAALQPPGRQASLCCHSPPPPPPPRHLAAQYNRSAQRPRLFVSEM